MNMNVKDNNKLHVFLFLLINDLNLEVVQDRWVVSSCISTFIFHMHKIFIEIKLTNINPKHGFFRLTMALMFQ
jgi:hypothetical protein